MNTYKDKNGKVINEGDIIFYNEPIPYAESLQVIELIDGQLHARHVIGNTGRTAREYKFYAEDKPISLEWHTYDREGTLSDSEVIGNIEDNTEFLTVEYATKKFPLVDY